MFLLDDLLIGLPAKGLLAIFKEIHDLAQAELTDESKIKEELLNLHSRYETYQITEDEYQKKEAVLLERLTLIRVTDDDPDLVSVP